MLICNDILQISSLKHILLFIRLLQPFKNAKTTINSWTVGAQAGAP